MPVAEARGYKRTPIVQSRCSGNDVGAGKRSSTMSAQPGRPPISQRRDLYDAALRLMRAKVGLETVRLAWEPRM